MESSIFNYKKTQFGAISSNLTVSVQFCEKKKIGDVKSNFYFF